MKKLVKNNEKMPAYIGSDCFDPTFLDKDVDTSDTEEMTVEPGSAPEAEDF